ncbi:hypothetical protein WMF38_56900 [Sorangium sp. So ce118]
MTIEQFLIGFLREAAFQAYTKNPRLGGGSPVIRFLMASQRHVDAGLA